MDKNEIQKHDTFRHNYVMMSKDEYKKFLLKNDFVYYKHDELKYGLVGLNIWW